MPYSVTNLHHMAAVLKIKSCWFHRDHYDIPKRRIAEIEERCSVVSPRVLLTVIRTKFQGRSLEELPYERIGPGHPMRAMVDANKAIGRWVCDAEDHNAADGCSNPSCFKFRRD